MGKKHSVTRLILLTAALLTLLLTAACGGAPAAAPPASNPPADAGGDQAAAAEKLIIATNAEFPPFEFISEQGSGVIGEYDGVDIMLAQALAAELGMEVEISNMDFDAIIPAVISGKATVGIAGMTITEERLANVDFSIPYWVAVQSIIVPAESEIAGVDDLQGKKVGIITGFTGDIALSAIGGIDLQHYKKGVDAVLDLNNGRIEAVVIDSPTAHKLIANFPDMRAIDDDPVFETESYAICAAKGNDEFLAKLNAALQTLIDNGEIENFAAEVDARL
ncbi:MAG: transporter substrate-binding domain-containing protein [Gracilibacteraceae bacterium]|jgi:polar amino acid transport system substrate-binding protein|nr:transporter substrate-binding domain-containing protein [Gracilibacteraceae bacterium]